MPCFDLTWPALPSPAIYIIILVWEHLTGGHLSCVPDLCFTAIVHPLVRVGLGENRLCLSCSGPHQVRDWSCLT